MCKHREIYDFNSSHQRELESDIEKMNRRLRQEEEQLLQLHVLRYAAAITISDLRGQLPSNLRKHLSPSSVMDAQVTFNARVRRARSSLKTRYVSKY